MIDEQFMEDCISECPRAFVGYDLEITERQALLGGFRPDLICNHRGEILIIEIQQRALDRPHLYKCLEYRDLLKRANGRDQVRVVVICNSIDKKYLPLAETHNVEIIAIDQHKFIDLAAQFCPNSIGRLLKRDSSKNVAVNQRIKTDYHFRPLGWSQHLSLAEIISHINTECGRNNLELSNLREGRYWSIMHEIESLIFSDHSYSIESITDPQQWNIDRLLCSPSEWQPDFIKDINRIRKPSIELVAFETSQRNLSIIWRPKTDAHNRNGIYKVGDWARWPGEGTYGWSRPSNEIIFIRDVEQLQPGEISFRAESSTCNWAVLDELFISLIKAAYDWLVKTLSATVQVEKITDFEFKLVDPSPNDFDGEQFKPYTWAPKRITGWSIYGLETRRREIEAEWIGDFAKQYGAELNHFIDVHNTCLSRGRNRSSSNRSRHMSVDFEKEGIKLSPSVIDNILKRLRDSHPHQASRLAT